MEEKDIGMDEYESDPATGERRTSPENPTLNLKHQQSAFAGVEYLEDFSASLSRFSNDQHLAGRQMILSKQPDTVQGCKQGVEGLVVQSSPF